MVYNIKYKPQAEKDIDNIIDYIEQELFSPVVAERFARGLFTKIEQLRLNAGIFAISTYKDVLKYGAAAHHVLYKGFAIIYSFHDNWVVVHRVIHGSLIRE